ncbi:MAG TPA: hypothetical protein VK327_12410, partial [Candidatus Paceibacterota bacterium]|nr:hypothetical protein [Candidatus Paceibacterota bacterium]
HGSQELHRSPLQNRFHLLYPEMNSEKHSNQQRNLDVARLHPADGRRLYPGQTRILKKPEASFLTSGFELFRGPADCAGVPVYLLFFSALKPA